MAGTGFHVSTDELRSHSSAIGSVAESVDSASEAAGEKRMGGEIYGVLFDAIILPLLNKWADHLHGSITDQAELARTISTNVKNNADIYDMAEDDTNKTVTNSGGE